jgi:tetratricopeptide (TPR) repeat protein
MPCRIRFAGVSSLLLLAAFQPFALAQHPGPPSGAGRGTSGGVMPVEQQSFTLLVSVREPTGGPLDMGAIVKLDSYAGSVHATTSTRDAGTAVFPDIRPGDYNVEVSAPGYKTTTEMVEVLGGGSSYTVYIYIQPESAAGTPNLPGNPSLMTPRLQAEIDKAVDKMRRQQYDAARLHLEKAAKMAPGNPDIQYLLGFLESKQDHFEAARAKFQAAISLNPAHEKSYVMLGELQLRTGHAADAAQTLEKAYQLNGADWRMHLLLAEAYALQKQYDKAEPHAARAAALGKNNGAPARLLLGRILAAQSKTQEASRAFQTVLHDFPNDVSAQEARTELAALERPVIIHAAAKTPGPNLGLAPAADSEPAATKVPPIPVVVRAWAPPDIDAKEYPVAPDVACQQDQIVHRAQLRTAKQLANFERFIATEQIVHQEVDANGNRGAARTRDFAYLVIIEHAKDGSFFLDEERDGGQNLNEFPTHLASTGLVSLGVAVFREDFQNDLIYRCEGLGKWRGQPAWQIRFEQRKEAPSRLRTWRNSHGTFRLPLKGRVWVSANTFDVLHLETDLREPQEAIELKRDHLIVDYGPVHFEHDKTSLWLPWYAELFMELHGKRYHHRHTLSNYALFSVDTSHTISLPGGD